MNTVSAEEIERHGVSALDELLKEGPVHVTKNGRPSYVIMSEKDYARLIRQRGLWALLEQPTRGTRSREDIDAQVGAEREGWGKSR
jgi:prevent-host-death family protein